MSTQIIIEIKEYLQDSNLIENIYAVKKLMGNLETDLHFMTNINRDDYAYINTIIQKIKVNLEKVNAIIKLQE